MIPFFTFARSIRKMIYTTIALEALPRSLRKIIKTRGSYPSDDAALKLLYLAIKNAGLRWRRRAAFQRSERQAVLNQIDGFQNQVAAFTETAAIDPSSGS